MKNPYKRKFIAAEVEENGKYYAYVIPVTNSDNLIHKLKVRGIVAANLCDSKREAGEIVTAWNEAHKANGTYMFDQTF